MNPDFRTRLRTILQPVEMGGVGNAQSAYVKVKKLLEEEGLGADCYLGADMIEGGEICVRWYAGQFLTIVDKQSWFAMNSFFNCLDRFCPEEAPVLEE
jgi:hypothetical protein